MSESNMSNFTSLCTSLCSNLVQQGILTPVVQYLRTTKRVEVTVEELVEMLGMPLERSPPASSVTSFRSLAPPMVTSVEKKTKTVKDPAKDTGITCSHIRMNGPNKGEPCGKPVKKEGSTMCATCTKRENNRTINKNKAVTNTVSGVPTAPQVGQQEDVITPLGERTLFVNTYEGNPNWCHEPTHDFLLLNGEEHKVFARLDREHGPVPLSEIEKARAQELGFTVIEFSAVVAV